MDKVVTKEEITDRKVVYDGYTNIEEVTVTNGDESYTREVLVNKNTVAAIVKDTAKNKYIFVQQYRAAAEGVMVEVVHGEIDEGEKPEEALKREIMEEIGYKVEYMNHIFDFYQSPGRMSGICSLFYVEVNEQVHEGGGISDEDINIVEAEMLGLNGRIFFQDPMGDIEEGVEQKMIPPYQLIDATSLIAVSWMENTNTLKSMSEVITQSKIRSL
jgi:ADP-ribose pyrophosphatase